MISGEDLLKINALRNDVAVAFQNLRFAEQVDKSARRLEFQQASTRLQVVIDSLLPIQPKPETEGVIFLVFVDSGCYEDREWNPIIASTDKEAADEVARLMTAWQEEIDTIHGYRQNSTYGVTEIPLLKVTG